MIRAADRVLVPLLVLVTAASCSPFYVLRASYEQAKILSRREPIERVAADPRTDAETGAKLQLVLDARDFAEHVLRLDAGRSYTTFSQVDSDTLLLVLSGSRKDRFQAHTWWFPFVGRVPYKGFFSPSEAAAERDRLRQRDLDVHLRPAAAFSTLGWFNDPLLSTLLRHGEVSLANTVIHEITHNTFYAPGEARFNESFANFVGGRGAIEFFCRREGAAGERCQRAQDDWHDDLLFGAFLSELIAELETLYGREDLTSDQKIRKREEVFAGARADFASQVRPGLRTPSFRRFEEEPLNNATLIARRLYYHRLELFDAVLDRYGGDLTATIHGVIGAARAGRADPFGAVERLIE
jgi:predicted aminopeptidase